MKYRPKGQVGIESRERINKRDLIDLIDKWRLMNINNPVLALHKLNFLQHLICQYTKTPTVHQNSHMRVY